MTAEYLDDETLADDDLADAPPELETEDEYGPIAADPPGVPAPPEGDTQNEVVA